MEANLELIIRSLLVSGHSIDGQVVVTVLHLAVFSGAGGG